MQKHCFQKHPAILYSTFLLRLQQIFIKAFQVHLKFIVCIVLSKFCLNVTCVIF